MDAVAALLRRRARGAPGLLPERHHAAADPARPRPRRAPRCSRRRTDWIGQWPSAWLGGLGTPWNTLQLGGTFRLLSPGVTIESVEGRWRLDGRVDLDLESVSSRLTTLDTLGSYKVSLTGGQRHRQRDAALAHRPMDGPLAADRQRHLGAGRRQVPRRSARSAAVDEAALSNLLNIIGRRDGARSIISIG